MGDAETISAARSLQRHAWVLEQFMRRNRDGRRRGGTGLPPGRWRKRAPKPLRCRKRSMVAASSGTRTRSRSSTALDSESVLRDIQAGGRSDGGGLVLGDGSNEPMITVYVRQALSGDVEVSLEPLKGVAPTRIPLPSNPVFLDQLRARVDGAIRAVTGVSDIGSARKELKRLAHELLGKRRTARAAAQAEQWRDTPSTTEPVSPHHNASVRTLSGGLPGLGKRH